MPLDPNIPLSYQPVQVPDPLVTETRLANLRNLASANQLQQARLTGVQQLNTERATATQDENTIRQSWLDSGGDLQKTSQLALARGASPTAVMGFDGQVTGARQKAAALDSVTLSNQQKKNNSLAGLLAPVAAETDPVKQEQLWNQALSTAQKQGLMSPAEATQHSYPGEDGVKAYAASLKTEDQLLRQALVQREQTLASAEQARAHAEENRTAALAKRTAPTTWTKENDTRNGHSLFYNRQTGEERVGGPVDMAAPGARSGRAGASGATPTQLDRDRMKNNATAADAEKSENQADILRTAIGKGLQGGYFVDANGKPETYDKLLPQGKTEDDDVYAARRAKAVAAFQAQLRQRYALATKAANEATARKNNAIAANGGRPQFSTAQAVAARSGNAQPAAPAAQPQPAAPNAQDPTISVKLPNGQYLSGPRSKMNAYLRSKGLQLQQQ